MAYWPSVSSAGQYTPPPHKKGYIVKECSKFDIKNDELFKTILQIASNWTHMVEKNPKWPPKADYAVKARPIFFKRNPNFKATGLITIL